MLLPCCKTSSDISKSKDYTSNHCIRDEIPHIKHDTAGGLHGLVCRTTESSDIALAAKRAKGAKMCSCAGGIASCRQISCTRLSFYAPTLAISDYFSSASQYYMAQNEGKRIHSTRCLFLLSQKHSICHDIVVILRMSDNVSVAIQ